jgi:hypothetical protein
MTLFVDQMISCAFHKMYYPAIITACALPDICAALDTNGKADRTKYISWFDTYAAKYYDGYLCGNDAYYLRCSVLHQGRVTHKDLQQHNAIGFIEPHSPFRMGKNHVDNIFYIEVHLHCQKLGKAVSDWLKIVENTENYQKNYQTFFKRAPSEIYMHIYDVPIIIAV